MLVTLDRKTAAASNAVIFAISVLKFVPIELTWLSM
jgi:hypothetical protein